MTFISQHFHSLLGDMWGNRLVKGYRFNDSPTEDSNGVGFRFAKPPNPSSLVYDGVVMLRILCCRRIPS